MSNVNLIAFGTFGNPNGFTQTFFAGNPIKDIKAFDIRGPILIYPNSKLYAIRKEYKNGQNMIAYAIYTYAKEPTSARSGSFIGSSILFVDKIAEENITIKNLNEFHQNLIAKNVQNDTITVNHSENFDVRECKPKDFDKIGFNVKNIEILDFAKTSGKSLVVFCETNPDKLQSFFKKSVDLLNVYDTIYFTSSQEIATFVNQKGIFKFIQNVGDKKEFEQEIYNLQEERKRKMQESLDGFSREKQKLEDARKKTYEDFESKIEKNEELHLENSKKIDEFKKDLHKINDFYNSFSRKIDELSNQLKSGNKKLDEINKIYNDYKRVFRESISNLKTPNFINSVSQPRATTEIRETLQPQHNWNNQYENRRKKEYKLDYFKVATLVLLLLWIGTMVYFLFFKKPEKETVYVDKPQQEQTSTEEPTNENTSELNPKPNATLNENDYRNVAKNLKYNTQVNDVIEIIFKNNPTDIKSSYDTQREVYSKQLIDKNKDCFVNRDGIFYFVKDTLKHIPSYKNQ